MASITKKSIIRHFQEVHKSYELDPCVWNGATIVNIISQLPKDAETIATFDATIVVCNINRPKGRKKTPVYSPSSDQGVEFMKLCMELRKHKRALIIVGGSGFQWKLSPPEAIRWDNMVSQLIGIMAMAVNDSEALRPHDVSPRRHSLCLGARYHPRHGRDAAGRHQRVVRRESSRHLCLRPATYWRCRVFGAIWDSRCRRSFGVS